MNKRPSIPLLSRPPHLFVFLFSLFTALALCASAPAETVTITTAADWAAFADRVNAGETTLDARMAANVTLSQDSPFVGTDQAHAYAGTFDGNGRTLAVNWHFTDGTAYVAPFRFANACTIKNLHVAGSLESNGKYVAGFIGDCVTNAGSRYNYITNCRSSVAITCTISGDATSGGFVGLLENSGASRLQYNDCLFDGFLLGPTASCCGGFTGWRPSAAYAKYYNCLFAPAEVTVSTNDSYTFSRPGWDAMPNCYYMQAFGSPQGNDASGVPAGDIARQLGNAWTVVNGQVALVLFPSPSIPPAPLANGFTYQGALKDISGMPLTGEQAVEFRLYDTATGGTPLWERSCTVLLDGNGRFNVPISDEVGDALEGTTSTNSLAAILAQSSSSTLYVGLIVSGSDGEIAPRQRILSVPYASFAADAANASGDFAVAGCLSATGLDVSRDAAISGNALVNGNVIVTSNATANGELRVAGTIYALGTAPVGAIVIWNGNPSQLPDGWALCDGTTNNGVVYPDLRDRFVVGAGGSYGVGNTGGTASYTLSSDQLPAHSHLYVGDDHLDLVKSGSTGYSATGDNLVERPGGYDAVSDNSGNSAIYRTSSTGDGASIDNRPPYYALCYIMRVK